MFSRGKKNRIKIITQAMGGKPDTQSTKRKKETSKNARCADHKKGNNNLEFSFIAT